jgi:hypothetical protein
LIPINDHSLLIASTSKRLNHYYVNATVTFT